MTHYVKMDTVDMHTGCPVVSKIKALEDTVAFLQRTLALTDKQRRAAEDTRSGLLSQIGELEKSLGLVAEQRDSAEKSLRELLEPTNSNLEEKLLRLKNQVAHLKDLNEILRKHLHIASEAMFTSAEVAKEALDDNS